MALFIDDGFTQTKQVPAEPGIHDAAAVVYRPALARSRAEYASAVAAGWERTHAVENDILARQVVSVGGHTLTKELAARLVPALRAKVLDLVLGYAPGDTTDAEAAAKN